VLTLRANGGCLSQGHARGAHVVGEFASPIRSQGTGQKAPDLGGFGAERAHKRGRVVAVANKAGFQVVDDAAKAPSTVLTGTGLALARNAASKVRSSCSGVRSFSASRPPVPRLLPKFSQLAPTVAFREPAIRNCFDSQELF